MSLDSFVRITAIPECFEGLQADAERMRGDLERLQRFVELAMAKQVVAPAPSPAPEASTPVPVEMESIARQRLEQEAAEAAKLMVESFELLKNQQQTTATSLACALRVMRDASAGFECPQTMVAIQRALYGMDAASREAQNNG